MARGGPEDFLELEGRIAARIEAAVPELAGAVTPLGDPGDMLQTARENRAWLVPGRTSYDSDKSGRAIDVTQRWQVILTCRNVGNMRSGEPARRQAGPLITKIIQALAGWHPGSPYGLLRIVTPSLAPSWFDGVLMWPLEFETKFAFMAQTPMERNP